MNHGSSMSAKLTTLSWMLAQDLGVDFTQGWHVPELIAYPAPAFGHHLPGTKDHYLTQTSQFLKNFHGEGGQMTGRTSSHANCCSPLSMGRFGAAAKSSQAHSPFTTPRHEQMEEHSPFPAPYMEQISVKEIIQPEGVIQIIPNRHDGDMLSEIPYMAELDRFRSPKYLVHKAALSGVWQQAESPSAVTELIFQPLPLKADPRAVQPLCLL